MRKLYDNHNNNKNKRTSDISDNRWLYRLLDFIKPSYQQTQDNITNDNPVILEQNKKNFLKGIFIYAIALILCCVIAYWDMATINEINKLQTYSKVTQDFSLLHNALQDLKSDNNLIIKTKEKKELSLKAIKNITYLAKNYPFIDAFYLTEVKTPKKNDSYNELEEKILNNINKIKSEILIHDFQIFNSSSSDNYYDLYSKTVIKEIKNILKNDVIKKSGFYYFDILKEKSAFYVLPQGDDTFIFIRLNQQYLSHYYSGTNVNIFFKNKAIANLYPNNKFSFNIIKNIDSLYYEESGYGNISKWILYCCIFVGINIIAIAWYRSVCNYYIGQTKITLLNNQLKLINKNRSGSENRTQHLIESSNLVPWTADPENHTFTYIGEQIVDMTGIAYETWVTSGFWLSHIYEDDRHILFKAINDIKSQRYVTIEYRIYGNNGDIMWLRNTISKSSYYSAEEEEAGRIIFQGFLTDITDQKRVFETLENARLTAEKASQMKSNFLASMSHELRTPLNSIIGFADIIRTIKLENNEKNIKEYSENILFSGKHLLDLINDILDYSKIEAGEFEIRLEPTPVADIFKACQKLLQNRAETSNISLFFKIPDDSLVINVDPVRIKQVLINLISNAIKFNRPNGKVALVYEINEEQELIFKVTDTGIGMKPEDLKVALEKFRQVDAARSRNQEGTGLGLSISKSLIELHGGTLSIKSIYGKGTQVSIIFPPHIIYIHNSSIAN